HQRRLAARSAAQGRALRRQHRRALVLDRRSGDDPRRRLSLYAAGRAPAAERSPAAVGCAAASAALGLVAPSAARRESASPAPPGWLAAAAPAAAVAVARSPAPLGRSPLGRRVGGRFSSTRGPARSRDRARGLPGPRAESRRPRSGGIPSREP